MYTGTKRPLKRRGGYLTEALALEVICSLRSPSVRCPDPAGLVQIGQIGQIGQMYIYLTFLTYLTYFLIFAPDGIHQI